MTSCFGPLGGALAILGAVGLLLVIFGGIFWFDEVSQSTPKSETKEISPLQVAFFTGVVLLVLALILGIINQTMLPASCLH